VKGLQELGEKHHATAGQVTLAWLLAQGEDIIPIPGTKKIKVLFRRFSTILFALERLTYSL
jgi:aryl-alcohol dehydrogenase-like predicted oxidoreductase